MQEIEVTSASRSDKGLNSLDHSSLQDYVISIVHERHYAIEVSLVKEIVKISNITPLPNAYYFVNGVYNLRGEIIPILDMKKILGKGASKKNPQGLFNVIILNSGNHLVGIIVETLLGVISYPISGLEDIHSFINNMDNQFVLSSFRHEDNLYWIINSEKLFIDKENILRYKEEENQRIQNKEKGAIEVIEDKKSTSTPFEVFLENLKQRASFYVNPLNESWLHEETKSLKYNANLVNSVEYEKDLINRFYSYNNNQFWGQEFYEMLAKSLKDRLKSSTIRILDIGCASGHSSYSIAAVVRTLCPEAHLSVYSCDNNLQSITQAAELNFNLKTPPEYLKPFLIKEDECVCNFNTKITDATHFDFHNILTEGSYEDIDLIIARDLFSFLEPIKYDELWNKIKEYLKPGGLLLLGNNEKIPPENQLWTCISSDLSLYQKQ